MPSPFPGMDPFLEHPEIFPDLHDRLVINSSEALQGQLPPPYFAYLNRRVWIEVSERTIGPDVNILRPRAAPPAAPRGPGGVALAPPRTSQMVVVHVPHDEIREPYVEIYVGPREQRRLVTTIEVLSPTNKTPGAHGRELYRRKQQEIMESRVHLVEIDLLRAGPHTTAVPEDRLRRVVGDFDYHVCVHRFDNLEDYFVYPVRLDEPLPAVDVPLLPGDGGVPLNLQAVFNRCYDTGPYARDIDYAEADLVPPLPPERLGWVRERLSPGEPRT
jgi:Protein of unknown function (DUF4058)